MMTRLEPWKNIDGMSVRNVTPTGEDQGGMKMYTSGMTDPWPHGRCQRCVIFPWRVSGYVRQTCVRHPVQGAWGVGPRWRRTAGNAIMVPPLVALWPEDWPEYDGDDLASRCRGRGSVDRGRHANALGIYGPQGWTDTRYFCAFVWFDLTIGYVALLVPDLQMSCSDLTRLRGYRDSCSSNGHQAVRPVSIVQHGKVLIWGYLPYEDWQHISGLGPFTNMV